MDLKNKLIKLGSKNPDLQKDLRPVIDFLNKTARSKIFVDAWRDGQNDIGIKLVGEFNNAIIPFDSVEKQAENLDRLKRELAQELADVLGGSVKAGSTLDVDGSSKLALTSFVRVTTDGSFTSEELNQVIESKVRDYGLVPRGIKIR